MSKGYIYVGTHFHRNGKSLDAITDKKIGLSVNVPQREAQLNSTKSTIGYTMLKCWEVENMEVQEKILHNFFDSARLTGEWFDDEDGTLLSCVSTYMDLINAKEFALSTPEDKVEALSVSHLQTLARNADFRKKYPGLFKEGQSALTQTITTQGDSRATAWFIPMGKSYHVGIKKIGGFEAFKAMDEFVNELDLETEVKESTERAYIKITSEEEAVALFKQLTSFLEGCER